MKKKRKKKMLVQKFGVGYCPTVFKKERVCIAIELVYCKLEGLEWLLVKLYCNTIYCIARGRLVEPGENCISIH